MPTLSPAVVDVLLQRLAAIDGGSKEDVWDNAVALAATAPPMRVTREHVEEGNFTYCSYYACGDAHTFLVFCTLKEHVVPEAIKYVHHYIDRDAVVIPDRHRGVKGANLATYPNNYVREARELAVLPAPKTV